MWFTRVSIANPVMAVMVMLAFTGLAIETRVNHMVGALARG